MMAVTMKLLTPHVLATATALILSAASLPGATIYTAALSGANEVPAVVTSGSGSATLTLNGNSLGIAVNFSSLGSNDVAAHIHCCAVLGTNAPVALGFTGFPLGVTSGSFNATFDLLNPAVYTAAFLALYGGTATGAETALINGLNTGLTYVNIHTTLNPGGEIRGQVSATPEPGTWALFASGMVMVAGFVRRRRRG